VRGVLAALPAQPDYLREMLKFLGVVASVALVLLLALPAVFFYMERFVNPGLMRELKMAPDGDRAQKVMILTLPSGREIPVNYLREGDWVFAGADGRWWRELEGGWKPVALWIRGEALRGSARSVTDQPDRTRDVFSRLRPRALPGTGTLVEIHLGSMGLSSGR